MYDHAQHHPPDVFALSGLSMTLRTSSLSPFFDNTFTGISCITAGLFLFSIQDVIIKSFSDTYPVLQIVFTRSCVGLVIILLVLLVPGRPASLRLHRKWPVMAKGTLGFLSYLCYYLAMASLPLAETATITFLAPVIVTALSAVLFREKVGIHRWSAIGLGFLSIVMIVGPQGHFNNPAVILALMAAFTYAFSTLLTRYIDPRDSAGTSAFYTMLVFLVLSMFCSALVYFITSGAQPSDPSYQFLLRAWRLPTQTHLWLMILLGGIAAVGFYCLIRAYMVAEFSSIAPFEYTYLLWGIAFGYLVFMEFPAPQSIIGIMLLVASNFYILRREIILKRRTAFRRPQLPRR